MKRLIIAAALALGMFAALAPAQTCPNAISTSNYQEDQGGGPNYNFTVDGTAVANGGSIGIHVITPTLNASPSGYVNVRPGYNGCQTGWTYFVVTEWKLTRLRDGFTETSTTRVGPDQSTGCNPSYSCWFALQLSNWQPQLSLGEWQFQSIVYSQVTSIEGVSYNSPSYTGSIIVNISAR